MGTRRGHGEGSIYQRGDGLWCTAVDLGYIKGKRKRKYIYGKTRKEVAEKLKVALRDQQLGLPIATERQTVEQFLNRWLTDVIQGAVRPRTYESYEATVRLHIIPTLGRHELAKLTAQHVQSLLRAKSAEKLAPGSVRYIRSVLRSALNKAVRWDLIPRNVATLVSPPRAEHHEVRTFTPEEARQFLAAVRDDRLEALFTVALALGLRQGEAFGLRWPDIDLDQGVLRVRTSLQRIHGKLTFTQPKTEKSRRTISLPATTAAALRAHRVRQMQERLVAGLGWEDHDLVFANTEGKPLEKANVGKRLKELLASAGLPPMRFHDLRHCCASLLLAQNVHPKAVQEILGHSQIAMTLDLYSHVLPHVRREAADLMDRMLAAND